MEYPDKFVDFKKYCALCEHKEKKDWEDPCNECMDYPVNEHTRKPVNFTEKK
jgi:hypothetical protein